MSTEGITVKLAPSLHRLGNDIVACYMLDLPDGITLIDAGLPGHWNDLLRELDAVGRPLADVRGLVLTHGDSDHIGFAERLRRETGVPIFIHAADAHRARTSEKPKTAMGPLRLGPTLGFLAYGLRKNAVRTRHVEELVEIDDGHALDLPGAPRIVGLPGHSPGSIAVHVPAVDAVFVGDALTTRHVLTGHTGAQLAPFTDDRAGALASIDHLSQVSASWVLPGHGAPWHGSPVDIAAAIREP